MILGSHQLKGKLETLKEPFCILEKEYIDEKLHYKVVGVVKEKLLFNQYPKIIMRWEKMIGHIMTWVSREN